MAAYLSTPAYPLPRDLSLNADTSDRRWYAVFTLPQNEKSVTRHLDVREVESFLPTYETERLWKNRQRVKVVLPLFPTYLFVRINSRERSKVLQSPGVLRIVGNCKEPLSLPDSTIEFLRSGLCQKRVEPYHEFAVGQKARIKTGIMQGVQGVLIRKSNSLRFVLSIELIQQHAAVEVSADDLELVHE
jgi:transcription antitermination factor NusG